MASVMQPLRDEHAELLPHIEQLRRSGDGISSTSPAGRALDENLEFLEQHLLPHAMAEDEVLYPAVARLMNSEGAPDTMRRDHVAVGELIEELRKVRDEIGAGKPSEAQASAARRLLYGLYTLVSVHFAKEEEIYVPILESLPASEAATLYHDLEAAAGRARQKLGIA